MAEASEKEREFATAMIKRFEALQSERGNWSSHWEEVAERIWPDASDFDTTRARGEKRQEKVFDATAAMALDRFSSAMQSMLTPPGQRWHTLMSSNEKLMRRRDVAEWYESATKVLFLRRYDPRGNFSNNMRKYYKSLGSFGTAVLFVDELSSVLRYRTVHLNDIFIDENHVGRVDIVFRRMSMTLRQVVQKWGEDVLSDEEREALTKAPDTPVKIIHVVMPREDFDPYRLDMRSRPFASYYIHCKNKRVLGSSGYYTFPYIVSRYEQGPNEIYGRSPAMMVLPDIKMVNEMSKSIIRAAHKAIAPPILMHDDGVFGGGSTTVDMRPGAVNMGGVSPEGRPLMQPFISGARLDVGEELLAQRRASINDAFLVTLFQILVETPRMTATEALIRAQEKGALLAPAMDRQQSECLGPLIERELDLAMRAGAIPPMPEALREEPGYQVVYHSPLNRLQQTEELVGIQSTLEMAGQIGQFDPSIYAMIDTQEMLRISARQSGAPVAIIKSPERIAQEQAAMAEQQERQQVAEQAPQVADAIKKIAEARKAGQ